MLRLFDDMALSYLLNYQYCKLAINMNKISDSKFTNLINDIWRMMVRALQRQGGLHKRTVTNLKKIQFLVILFSWHEKIYEID